MKGYITDYENLQTWFEMTGETRWNLYSGFLDKFNNAHILAKQENAEMDVEESFNILKNMIQINSPHGGQFTVFVTGPGNRGYITRMRIASAMTPGVAGFPQMAGYPGMGMVSVGELEERIRRERREWELERRIEDLEAEKESSVGAVGQFFNRVTQDLDINNLIKMGMAMWGSRVGMNPDHLRAVQLSGTPDEDQHADGTGYTYEDPQVLTFLDSIRCNFATDEEFLAFLAKVENFFHHNRDMALNFFKNA